MKTILIGIIILCAASNVFADFVTVCDADMSDCRQIWIMD